MRSDSNIFLYLIFFLVGAFISYFLCQFDVLQIDTKVSVPTILMSIITAIIGLYLAISLKKNQTKSSNLHSYLQPKLDATWKLFLSLSHQLSLKDQLEIRELSKGIKEINQNITPLKKMFLSFGIQSPCMDSLESEIDGLEKFLVACPVKNNIIIYASERATLRSKLDNVHSKFVEVLKTINEVS